MSRKLEVIEAAGKHSRLTISPSRITVKVRLADSEMIDVWVAAAKAIGERLNYGNSLRGNLRPGIPAIWLMSGHTGGLSRTRLKYSFEGELLQTAEGPREN